MTTAKEVTTWGILVTIAGLLGLEIWALTNNSKEDTISEVIQSKAHEWIFIPFLFGFLMGHWFWPLDTRRKYASK